MYEINKKCKGIFYHRDFLLFLFSFLLFSAFLAKKNISSGISSKNKRERIFLFYVSSNWDLHHGKGKKEKVQVYFFMKKFSHPTTTHVFIFFDAQHLHDSLFLPYFLSLFLLTYQRDEWEGKILYYYSLSFVVCHTMCVEMKI